MSLECTRESKFMLEGIYPGENMFVLASVKYLA